jgi:hypothetical protein
VDTEYNPGLQQVHVKFFSRPGATDSALGRLLLVFEEAHVQVGEVPYEYMPEPEWDDEPSTVHAQRFA